jgi:hypothetical protein
MTMLFKVKSGLFGEKSAAFDEANVKIALLAGDSPTVREHLTQTCDDGSPSSNAQTKPREAISSSSSTIDAN